MSTIITWVIIFAILCGCITFWVYMIHRGRSDEETSDGTDNSFPSCDGNCFSCAKNFSGEIRKPDDCSDHDYEYAKEMMNIR